MLTSVNMTDTRNWSTKTLARQLVIYLKTTDLVAENQISDLIDSLKSSIVEEEVGISLDPWTDDE